MRVSAARHRLHLLLAVALALAGWAHAVVVDQDRLRSVAASRYGPEALSVVDDWLRLIDLAGDAPRSEQLSRVNDFFNLRVRFGDDIQIWQMADYWATPLQTLVRGQGDCEDYAIAKYLTLRALGVPQSELRLIYVRARIDGRAQAHMVLGYYPDPHGEPLILDNLSGVVAPAAQRRDLSPIFSFNDEGLWAGGIRAASRPTDRLSNWRAVLGRIRDEGFR